MKILNKLNVLPYLTDHFWKFAGENDARHLANLAWKIVDG
jgi:hypothetical protein